MEKQKHDSYEIIQQNCHITNSQLQTLSHAPFAFNPTQSPITNTDIYWPENSSSSSSDIQTDTVPITFHSPPETPETGHNPPTSPLSEFQTTPEVPVSATSDVSRCGSTTEEIEVEDEEKVKMMRIVQVLRVVEGFNRKCAQESGGGGDDVVDIFETAKKRGMTFPPSRWFNR